MPPLACSTRLRGADPRRERLGRRCVRVVVYGGGPHGQRFIDALTRQPNQFLRVDAFFDERAKSIPNSIGDIPSAAVPTNDRQSSITRSTRFSSPCRGRQTAASSTFCGSSGRCPHRCAWHRNRRCFIRRWSAPMRRHAGARHSPHAAVPLGQFFKSIVDRAVAGAALIWFAPLLAGIAVAIN